MDRLKQKVCVITGANSGIGRETALLFAQEGAALVLAARRLDKLEEVAQLCRDYGAEVITVAADVSKSGDCKAVVDAAIASFARIDVLVNNAGVADRHLPITRCSEAWYDEICAIDQTSIFYMCKYALEYMEPAGSGSIINISSIGGVFGSSGIAYSAAKSAVLGMTKNIAIQFAGLGIRCNAVCPGPTPTALNTPEKLSTFDPFADVCARHMDMSRPEASALDQAKAILFFASDDSAAVTGQALIVDNGTTL